MKSERETNNVYPDGYRNVPILSHLSRKIFQASQLTFDNPQKNRFFVGIGTTLPVHGIFLLCMQEKHSCMKLLSMSISPSISNTTSPLTNDAAFLRAETFPFLVCSRTKVRSGD